jgi:deoxyribodipyrimidine photo-lyase
VHDHPALAAAARRFDEVIPMFVFDEGILTGRFAAPNRLRFLVEAIDDLRASLRQRGGELLVRRGDPVDEALTCARHHDAEALFVSADVTRFARRREARLAESCAAERRLFEAFPGVTVVPPGELTPTGGDHYKVFTPYWRAWRQTPWRPIAPTPRRVNVPRLLTAGRIPDLTELTTRATSEALPPGGASAGRGALSGFVRRALADSGDRRDDLSSDGSSRLSPYLHFGCLSAREVVARCSSGLGEDEFVRQLCWRDFHHQVTAAFGAIATRDYRDRGKRWRHDDHALAAWRDGRTGVPVVDAAMRQLRREGWMHNRARLIVAAYLTRDLEVDWRLGAMHFLDWLVDGDIANNSGNWQWVAGTGNDTRPGRRFNVLRQAARFDPHGDYVRRYVEELSDVDGVAVHQPWRLPMSIRDRLDYPQPIAPLPPAKRRAADGVPGRAITTRPRSAMHRPDARNLRTGWSTSIGSHR